MNRKITSSIIFVVFLFSALMVNSGTCATSTKQEPFSYDDLSATYSVTSPVGNATYTNSTVEIMVGVYIGSTENVKGSHYIPYQNISCVYSLDDSKWQNLTLIDASDPLIFPSLVNKYWYVTMWLNYTAVLYNVPEGSHHLKFDITQISERTREDSSEGKPPIFFNVTNSSSTSLYVTLIGVAVVLAIAIAVIIYIKKKTKVQPQISKS